MATATGPVVHGVYEFHGPNEPVHKGSCEYESHHGEREGVMLLGTIDGVLSCGECIRIYHERNIGRR